MKTKFQTALSPSRLGSPAGVGRDRGQWTSDPLPQRKIFVQVPSRTRMTRKHRTEYFGDPVNLALDGRYGDRREETYVRAIPQADRGSCVVLTRTAKGRNLPVRGFRGCSSEKESENGIPFLLDLCQAVLQELFWRSTGRRSAMAPDIQNGVSI